MDEHREEGKDKTDCAHNFVILHILHLMDPYNKTFSRWSCQSSIDRDVISVILKEGASLNAKVIETLHQVYPARVQVYPSLCIFASCCPVARFSHTQQN